MGECRGYGCAEVLTDMAKFLLWCILLVLCWPLALLALIAYPFVWLLLLPFRIVGIAVGGAGTSERHHFHAGTAGSGDLKSSFQLLAFSFPGLKIETLRPRSGPSDAIIFMLVRMMQGDLSSQGL